MPYEDLKEKIKSDQTFRKEVASRSLGWFTHIYLPHYLQNPTPDFHWEFYGELERSGAGFTELIAFRGSAKSTIGTVALPLWSATTGKRKFIIVASETGTQTKIQIANIKKELEENVFLIQDYGEFQTPKLKEEWTASNVVLANGARILGRSRGQKIRGLRHLQYRPDLVIADDIESAESVRVKEQRDKTEEWFLSEVLPGVDAETGRVLLIGNLLHSDSVIARIKKRIVEDEIGILKEFPLLNSYGNTVWPEKFTPEVVGRIKKQSGRFFKREYQLELVPEEGQIISSVAYYDTLPRLRVFSIGVDLAISQKQTADYTAINSAGKGIDGKMYNLKTRYGRWGFNETLGQINTAYTELKLKYPNLPIYVGIEDVAYQKSAIEEARRRYHLPIKEIRQTTDKRARLEALAPYFESGQILFPRESNEDLLIQLLNFGTERYDDLVDALEISMRQLINDKRPGILWI